MYVHQPRKKRERKIEKYTLYAASFRSKAGIVYLAVVTPSKDEFKLVGSNYFAGAF
jgi:hypothetical protein